ncbi:hypothetical protein M0805_007342 [Coniferiporia weirii]|nr:hypothetical protein M0805_007342 [Coniferiporia weirii]
MRHFASALSVARGGKSESESLVSAPSVTTRVPRLTKSRSNTLFTKAPKTPLETDAVSHSRPLLTPGSSSSSDGSASLRTPDDEGAMAFPKSEDKKKWSNWFGWRKPPDKLLAHGQNDAAQCSPHTTSDYYSRQGVPESLTCTTTRGVSDTEDDDSTSDSSDYLQKSTAMSPRTIPSHATLVQAKSNLRTLLRNSLVPLPSPPPLVDVPFSPHFPRSSAIHSGSQHAHTLESSIHVRKMLHRLERRSLTRSEAQSIAFLGTRPQPKVAARIGLEKRNDDDMLSYASMRVGHFSRGLRKWASRPCFEERYLVYQPDEGGQVVPKKVLGVARGLAVCDLEFSEGLEALGGLALDDKAFETAVFPSPPTSKGPSPKPAARKSSPPRGSPRKASFQSSPSPLRVEHSSVAKPILSPVSPVTSVASNAQTSPSIPIIKASESARSSSMVNVATMQRGVRFADTVKDADDEIPLGYAIQVKRNREEKDRFLQIEREKRTRQLAEMQKRAEEERKLAQEKRWVEERRRIEEEKRVREENRKTVYAEEIAAARQRRETSRAGIDSFTSIREAHQREQGPSYTRPAYDTTSGHATASQRRVPDYAGVVGPTDFFSLNDSSKASRPSSVVESTEDGRKGLADNSAYGLRPHLSSEEFRSPSSRQSVIVDSMKQHYSRPSSVVSSSARPSSLPRVQSVPVYVPTMPYPMIPVAPPVPAMPVWSMPLFPPNAPFMMQQYPRSSSPGSNSNFQNLPSQRHATGHVPTVSTHSQHSRTHGSERSRHSRHNSNDGTFGLAPPLAKNANGAPQKPLRSASYSPRLQPSYPQPPSRDSRPRQTQQGFPTGLAPPDTKRRTTMA